MKKVFTSFKLVLFSLLLAVGATAWAGDVEITFMPNNEMTTDGGGEFTVTNEGVTLAVSKGLSNDSQFRIYKGQTLTVSSTVGNIKSVVFTCTKNGTAKEGPGNFEVSDGEYTFEEEGPTGTWTGDAAEVVFTASANQVRATSIVVTVSNDGGGVSVTKPTITPATGSYTAEQTVTITGDEGNTLYYSLNDGEYQAYTEPFTVSETTTVKAKAVDADGNESSVATSVITIIHAESWSNIAEAKAASTADGVFGILNLENALVTYASGNYTYIKDSTGAILIYGTTGLNAGDKVTGTITGNNVIYNSGKGSLEIAVNVDGASVDVTTVSTENAVYASALQMTEMQNAPRDYESLYVSLSNVKFTSATWDNSSNRRDSIYTGEDTIVFYNQFKIDLTDLEIDLSKSYNVKGIVCVYNGNAQLYLISINDISIASDLQEPTCTWASELVEVACTDEQTCANTFTTNSDGTVTYASSDENVATVDAQGQVTIEGTGLVTISAETAETATYLAGKSSFTLMVFHGNGTQERPYNVDDVQYLFEKNGNDSTLVWVEGYVAGYVNGTKIESESVFDATTEEGYTNTNILLANAAGATDYTTTLPIQLTKGVVRDNLQISDVYGKQVAVQGMIFKYFGVAGIKGATTATVDGTAVAISAPQAENARPQAIYTLAGQKVNTLTRGGLYIVNGKKVLVK